MHGEYPGCRPKPAPRLTRRLARAQMRMAIAGAWALAYHACLPLPLVYQRTNMQDALMQQAIRYAQEHETGWDREVDGVWGVHQQDPPPWNRLLEIGRASCRERV